MQSIKRFFTGRVPWALLLVLGAVLRLRQYFFNRSLWGDEAALALNLVHRSFIQLTQPLDYGQGSPLAFLMIVKTFISLFGNHDYILRLFPLIAGLLALLLMAVLAREVNGGAGLLALAVFAVSANLVYFSTELKQYGTDALCVVLLLYLAQRCLKDQPRGRDFAWLGAAGALALWLSHPAAFVVAAVGLVLLALKLSGRVKVPLAWIAGLGLAWTASFALEYLVTLRFLIANDYLQSYWDKAFMPMPPWSDKRWFLETFFYLVSINLTSTDWNLGLLFGGLLVLGWLALLLRKHGLAWVIALTFGLALLASALHKYPLKDRFLLFLVPPALLLLAEALGALYRLGGRYVPRLALILPLLLGAHLISFVWSGVDILQQPQTKSEIRPVLAYLAQNRAPGDAVYVYHTAGKAYLYYAPFYGLDPENTSLGFDTNFKKPAMQHFTDDVKNLHAQGGRVWFIFSDVVDCGGCKGDMMAWYRAYLDAYGQPLQSVTSTNAYGFLYQMGNKPK